MPIYEYRCASCGHQQEFLQKVSDAPPTVCPKCHQPTLSKMVTAAGFHLKGSGWYATDFKSKAPAKAADAAKADAPKIDAPTTDAPKTDAPKVDTPKPAEKKSDAKSKALAC